MPPIHDDNPDPAGRGERRAIKRAPISGEVVGRRAVSDMDDDNDGPSAEDLERFGGETRTCPECRKDVFDDTAVCYHCGHAFMKTAEGSPGKSKRWVIATVVVLLAIFLFAAIGGVL